MAFLIVIAFLFSTIGVICLIVKTSSLLKKINANALTIHNLENELKQLKQHFLPGVVLTSAATPASHAESEVNTSEVHSWDQPSATSPFNPEEATPQNIFVHPQAQTLTTPQFFAQNFPQGAVQTPGQAPQASFPPADFTQPSADIFKQTPGLNKTVDASIFASTPNWELAASPAPTDPSYPPSTADTASTAPIAQEWHANTTSQASYSKPAWARSGELKPVPLNTLRMSAAAAQKQAEARDATSLWKSLSSFVSGGHLWVAGGVLLMFIAFALLLTYMASRGMFTIEMRIVTGALAGLIMLALGWHFRERKPTYALILQGGGIGLLYMSFFAASKFTTLLSPEASLILISLLIPPTIILAVKQNSQPLGMFGLLGGFAAPILLSTDSGNYVALFTYYSVLNIAVLIISRYKLWRGLNLLAFLCTFGVALVWTLSRYEPEMFATAEPFMLVFMAMFTWLGIQSAERREISVKNFVDLPITLGAPFLGAIIQWQIFSYIEHGLAFVCLAFAAIYLLLTFAIWKRKGVSVRSLAEGYLGLSVLLANLAIPLEMSATVTSAVWAAEGVLIYYFGARNASLCMNTSGLALHVAAATAFILREDYSSLYYENYSAYTNSTFTGCLIIAISAIATAVFANKFTDKQTESTPTKTFATALLDNVELENELNSKPNGELDGEPNEKLNGELNGELTPKLAQQFDNALNEKPSFLVNFLTLWGLVWWFGGWFFGYADALDCEFQAFFIICSLSALLGFAAARWQRCPPLAWAGAAPLLFAFCFTAGVLVWRTINLLDYDPLNILTFNFFENIYLWAWLLFFASQAALLYFSRKTMNKSLHAAWMFLVLLIGALVLIGTGRAYTQIWGLAESWTSLAGILPALAFVLCLSLLGKQQASLSSYHRKVMLLYLPVILCVGTSIWFIGTLFDAGNPAPLPLYIPLINPLEMQQAFCIAIIAMWQLNAQKAANTPSLSKHGLIALLDVMIFLWLTAMLARATHYFLDIPMLAVPYSGKFHLALLVLWGLYGIGHIVAGHKIPMRRIWLAGAILTIIDIAKLLLVDLAHTGTITRIISFFIAGLILLFIGWVAPLPPASNSKTSREANKPNSEASFPETSS